MATKLMLPYFHISSTLSPLLVVKSSQTEAAYYTLHDKSKSEFDGRRNAQVRRLLRLCCYRIPNYYEIFRNFSTN